MVGKFSAFCINPLAAIFAGALFCCALPVQHAKAAEIFSARTDTFIFEGMPDGEFSRSNFIAVAHLSGERAYSYLPFNTEVSFIGINPEEDIIVDATLTLFFKALPGELKSDEGEKAEQKKDSSGVTLRGDVEEKSASSEIAENESEDESESEPENEEAKEDKKTIDFSKSTETKDDANDSSIEEESLQNLENTAKNSLDDVKKKTSPPPPAAGSTPSTKSKRAAAILESLEKDLETIAEISKQILETADERAAEEMKNVVRIEVLGVVDSEHFLETSERFKYSWNGKHNAIAPKHDIHTGRIDEIGIYKLGEIEMDIVNDEYSDGQRIEFSSSEFKDFLSFVLGIAKKRGTVLKFQTHLEKMDRSAIILRQISGPSGVFFYSSDSLPESFQKPAEGEIVTFEIDEETGEIIGEIKEPEEIAPSYMERETVENAANSAANDAASAARTRNPETILETAEKQMEILEKSASEDEEETVEIIQDMRPRIILEFTNVGKIKID